MYTTTTTYNNNTIVSFSMLKIYLIFVFSSIGQYLTRAWLQQKKTRFMKQMNYLNYTTFIYSKTYIMSRNVFWMKDMILHTSGHYKVNGCFHSS